MSAYDCVNCIKHKTGSKHCNYCVSDSDRFIRPSHFEPKPSELETLRSENALLRERVKELEHNCKVKTALNNDLKIDLEFSLKQRNDLIFEIVALKQSKTVYVKCTCQKPLILDNRRFFEFKVDDTGV